MVVLAGENPMSERRKVTEEEEILKVAELLAIELVKLIQKAKMGEFVPPFELHVEDANGKLIVDAEVHERCDFTHVELPSILGAYYPIEVTLAERETVHQSMPSLRLIAWSSTLDSTKGATSFAAI